MRLAVIIILATELAASSPEDHVTGSTNAYAVKLYSVFDPKHLINVSMPHQCDHGYERRARRLAV